MRDDERDNRYYATLCASEIRPASVLTALVDRLFDDDYGTRSLAVEALAHYPEHQRDRALEGARRVLHSADVSRVRAAADAVKEIVDVGAVPDLLHAHERGGKYENAVMPALVEITKHDFGSSNRKWRAWWKDNKDRHRIEWMIEGLDHKFSTVRKHAAEELRTLTGENFRYNADMSKKERSKAITRWQEWWDTTGRQRFEKKRRIRRPTA
jgi:hypothetical protein